MKNLLKLPARVDHVAIAVEDLDEALFLYQGVLGFELKNRREGGLKATIYLPVSNDHKS